MDNDLTVPTPSIYTGAWTNWSGGRVGGSTLTLSTRDGAFLVAFLALYVRLAGSRLWTIISFIIFLLRSSPEPQDGLYHQQQALFKAKPSDLSAIWQHVKLGWVWRKTLGSRRASQRSLGYVLLSTVHAALFVVAGIFSSKVTSTVSDVLLNDVSCGHFPIPSFNANITSIQDILRFAAITAKVQRNLGSASGYAATCYRSSAVNTSWLDCRPLGRHVITWNKTHVPCPFGNDLCTTQAIQFDTGPICSNWHLGINAPEEDRVTYQRTMQCSPIKTEGYRRGPLDAASAGMDKDYSRRFDNNETFYGYFYGANGNINSSATYYIPSRQYPVNYVSTISINNVPRQYEISIESSDRGRRGAFVPELSLSGATTALIFLRKNTAFFDRVDDPWFSAHEPVNRFLTMPYGITTPNVTLYHDPEIVSVVACAESYQICNGANNVCTPFTNVEDPQSGRENPVASIGLNERQKATLNRIMIASGPTSLTPIITFLGANSLLASKYAALESLKLPDNQWIQELDHWFGTGMASLQLDVLQFVTGDGSTLQHLDQEPPGPDEHWMCSNQVTQRTDFASFSILALCLILIIGGIVMIISIYLNEKFISLKSFRQSPRGRHWIAGGIYQVQAHLFQLKNLGGTWINTDTPIPSTLKDDKFLMPLDLEVSEHRLAEDVGHEPLFGMKLWQRKHKGKAPDIKLSDLGTEYTSPAVYEARRGTPDLDRVDSMTSLRAPTFRSTMSSSSVSEAETLLAENGYKMRTIR